MAAFQEEIFGPVAILIPIDSDEEAIDRVNDTEYGLSAGIISPGPSHGYSRSHVGWFILTIVNDDVADSFGGVGSSEIVHRSGPTGKLSLAGNGSRSKVLLQPSASDWVVTKEEL